MFLDTSGLLSLYDVRDAFHEDALREVRRADRLLTHNYVLAEFVALANCRGMPHQDMLRRMQNLMDNPLVELLWINESLHRAGLDLLARRADKAYSLCDAISFLQMREFNVAEALTTDRHFEQEGLMRLLKR
jgi:uncharacterized protein